MKKILTLLLFLFLANIALSQRLDFTLLDKLTEISFASIDEFMIEYYGFEKLQNKSDIQKRTYARNYNNDLDNTIIITVLSSNDKPNVLEISLAKNYNIENIEEKLLLRGYEYKMIRDFEFSVFKKERSSFLISLIPNEAGVSKIKVITE